MYGDYFGDCAVVGDKRWTGSYGVDVDLVALEHCTVKFVRTEHIQVLKSVVRLTRKENGFLH